MLPKGFSFLQLLMYLTVLKSNKIPIINSILAIKGIVNVKTFLRNFPVTLSKRAMITFITVEPVTKFGFCFPNVKGFTAAFTF